MQICWLLGVHNTLAETNAKMGWIAAILCGFLEDSRTFLTTAGRISCLWKILHGKEYEQSSDDGGEKFQNKWKVVLKQDTGH